MNGRRPLMLAAVALTALVLQTVVFPSLTIAGWRPNLVVLAVVGFALSDGAGTGARYGFAAGILTDLINGGGHLLGLTALVLLLIGYGAGLLKPYLSGTGMVGPLAVTAVASAIAVLSFALLGLLLEVAPLTFGEVIEGTLITGLYNTALAPAALPIIQRLARRFPMRQAGGVGGLVGV